MWCKSKNRTAKKWHIVEPGSSKAICGQKMEFPIQVLWTILKNEACVACDRKVTVNHLS